MVRWFHVNFDSQLNNFLPYVTWKGMTAFSPAMTMKSEFQRIEKSPIPSK